jgi:hypothetical protein
MRTLFIIPLVLMSLVSFPSWGNTISIECKNKLTNKYIEEFPKFRLKMCDKYGEGKTDGKYLADCTRAQRDIMKMQSCQTSRDAGLLDWSHMQFINIPEFNKSLVLHITMPCPAGSSEVMQPFMKKLMLLKIISWNLQVKTPQIFTLI